MIIIQVTSETGNNGQLKLQPIDHYTLMIIDDSSFINRFSKNIIIMHDHNLQ